MSKPPVNYVAWERNALGFIRAKGQESEFSDWCGGWPMPPPEGSQHLSSDGEGSSEGGMPTEPQDPPTQDVAL